MNVTNSGPQHPRGGRTVHAGELPSIFTGKTADKLEAELGIPVLRHSKKKPAGGPEDLEKHFGCASQPCA